jgi:hypothetical protein
MVLRRVNDQSFGDSQLDVRDELVRYSLLNGYEAEKFADCVCECGICDFGLLIDDNVGAAARICHKCDSDHGIGDSDDYIDEAEPWKCTCHCGAELFEITIGVALYEGTEDVRWLYVGCRCPKCQLTGCYGDWKNEFTGYQSLLANV